MRGRRRESTPSAPAPSCAALYASPVRIPFPPVRRSRAAAGGSRAAAGGGAPARRLLARAALARPRRGPCARPRVGGLGGVERRVPAGGGVERRRLPGDARRRRGGD